MGIEEEQAVPRFNVVQDRPEQKRALAHAGLADDEKPISSLGVTETNRVLGMYVSPENEVIRH